MENRCRSAMDLRNRKSSLGGAVTSPTPPVYIIGASSLYASPQQLIHQSVRLKSNSASRLRSNTPAHAQPEVRRTLPMSRSYDHREALGKRQNQFKQFYSEDLGWIFCGCWGNRVLRGCGNFLVQSLLSFYRPSLLRTCVALVNFRLTRFPVACSRSLSTSVSTQDCDPVLKCTQLSLDLRSSGMICIQVCCSGGVGDSC